MRRTANTRTRAIAVVCGGVMGAVVLAASVAWACSPSAYVSARPGSGHAGSTVAVSGSQFHPTGPGFRPVEIRWNSATGEKLAEANGPSFSTSVVVPANAAPAVYYLVAVQRNANNDIVGRVSTPFEVTLATSSTNSSSGEEPAESTSTSASGRSTRTNTAAPATDTSSGSSSTSSNTATSESTGSPATTTETSATSDASATAQASPQPASAGRSVANATNANAATAPVAANTAAAPEPNATVAPAQSPEQTAISARSATADLWGGFATGDANASRGASLADPTSASSAPSPLGIGLAMLSVGLVALASGAAVAGRRRKALATTR